MSDKIDKILTHPILGLPIFAGIMAFIFLISITWFGDWSLTGMEWLFDELGGVVGGAMEGGSMPEWFNSLIVDGIIGGVGGVIAVVPQIMVLFMLMSLMEATGYMSRVAFMLDRLMRGIGLSGRSVISIVMGYGCSVPAVMSARTIKSDKQRDATIALVPFVPCSAKLPVFAFFTGVIFNSSLAATSMYFIGIAAVVLGGLILKFFSKNKADAQDSFVFELSPYRLPRPANVLRSVWDKGRAYIIKAGTIIFLMSIVIWVLSSLSPTGYVAEEDVENSFLAYIGKGLSWLFVPLGFGNWQATVSVLSGIIAKEQILSTMNILGMRETATVLFSPASAYSFMIFALLATPCVAAIGTIFKEASSKKKAWAIIGFQMAFAYSAATITYGIGTWIAVHPVSFWITLGLLLILVVSILIISYMIRRKKRGVSACGGCCAGCSFSSECNTKPAPSKDKKIDKIG